MALDRRNEPEFFEKRKQEEKIEEPVTGVNASDDTPGDIAVTDSTVLAMADQEIAALAAIASQKPELGINMAAISAAAAAVQAARMATGPDQRRQTLTAVETAKDSLAPERQKVTDQEAKEGHQAIMGGVLAVTGGVMAVSAMSGLGGMGGLLAPTAIMGAFETKSKEDQNALQGSIEKIHAVFSEKWQQVGQKFEEVTNDFSEAGKSLLDSANKLMGTANGYDKAGDRVAGVTPGQQQTKEVGRA